MGSGMFLLISFSNRSEWSAVLKALEASSRQQCTFEPLCIYSPTTILSRPVHIEVERPFLKPNWRPELAGCSLYCSIIHHYIDILKGEANAIPL